MLGADSETEGFGGGGGAEGEIGRAFLGVVEFVGHSGPICEIVGGRVEGMGGVDGGEGLFKRCSHDRDGCGARMGVWSWWL